MIWYFFLLLLFMAYTFYSKVLLGPKLICEKLQLIKKSVLLSSNSQHISWSSLTWLVKCKAPLQSLAALYCTVVTLANVCFREWNYRIMPYSRNDCIVSLYKRSPVFHWFLKQVICFSQSSVKESQSPKLRSWCTLVTKLSFNIKGGEFKNIPFLWTY